jgi:hypothetical protein
MPVAKSYRSVVYKLIEGPGAGGTTLDAAVTLGARASYGAFREPSPPVKAQASFMSGFEEAATLADLSVCAWDGVQGGAGGNFMALVTSPVRSGSQALRFQNITDVVNPGGWGTIYKSLGGSYPTLYFRVYVRPVSVAGRAGDGHATVFSFDNTYYNFYKGIGLGGGLVVRYDAGNTGGHQGYVSTGPTLAANTWYRMEARYHAYGGRRYKVFNEAGDLLGDSGDMATPACPDGFQGFLLGAGTAYAADYDIYYDDVALKCDASVTTDNWIGPGRVGLAVPGSTMVGQWTPTGSANRHENIDGAPNAYSDADYNQSSTLGQRDRFSPLHRTAIPAGSRVSFLSVMGRAQNVSGYYMQTNILVPGFPEFAGANWQPGAGGKTWPNHSAGITLDSVPIETVNQYQFGYLLNDTGTTVRMLDMIIGINYDVA